MDAQLKREPCHRIEPGRLMLAYSTSRTKAFAWHLHMVGRSPCRPRDASGTSNVVERMPTDRSYGRL